MIDLAYSGAQELAAAIRDRQVSAVEVLIAQLDRVARHNPALNAIVTIDEEGARRRAQDADRALWRGEIRGPLHGVPMTLKDSHSTAGIRTTAGYPPLADYVPAEDGTVAARLKAAGAIIVGKTNVPPLTSHIQTDNPIFGRTNNPWNLERTPGGSSGGACAALAAGLTPLEIGSDTAASIRLPAHFCGVFGLKTTLRRVSMAGHIPDLPQGPRLDRELTVIGPLARSVDDLALTFRIIAGADGRDTEVPPVPVADVPRPPLESLRIAWAPAFPGAPVAGDIRRAIERLADELARRGGCVEERLPPPSLFDEQTEVWEQLGSIRRHVKRVFQPELDLFPADGRPDPALSDLMVALHRRDALILGWEHFFDDWDVLICPPALTTAFPHCERGAAVAVDGEPVEYRKVNHPCVPFSITGHPAVVLPVSTDQDGLPVGVQVVTRRWDDERLLAIAGRLVEITGPFRRPPGY